MVITMGVQPVRVIENVQITLPDGRMLQISKDGVITVSDDANIMPYTFTLPSTNEVIRRCDTNALADVMQAEVTRGVYDQLPGFWDQPMRRNGGFAIHATHLH